MWGAAMLPFVRPGFRSIRWCLIVGAFSFVITSIPLQAEEHAETPERESLKGVVGIEVVVEPLNVEVEHLGLETLKLQHDIRHRLQQAGVPVLTERERVATSTAAMLVIRVDALHDRIGRYFYCIDVLLTQRVRLKGRTSPEVSAVTWMRPGGIALVADDNVKHIQDQVLRRVDQFIKDYVAVNPRGR
jgi:hypothetical protein